LSDSLNNVVEIQSLTKSFQKGKSWFRKEEIRILKEINLSIDENEFVLVLGKNGSGKSTLLKCISGILYPNIGKIKVLSQNPFQNRVLLSSKMGVLFGQKSLLFTDLLAKDYIQLLRKLYGLSEKEFDEAIAFVDHHLPCLDLMEKRVRGMSYGEKMKLEILSVVLHYPEILILDEPFVGLDQKSQRDLLDFILEYKKNYNATILLTTHQYLEVLQAADRAVVLEQGRIKYNGKISEVMLRYTNKKMVHVEWNKEVPEVIIPDSPWINVASQTNTHIDLEIDSKEINVSQLIQNLLTYGEIRDFEVRNISMDKVVERLYEETS